MFEDFISYTCPYCDTKFPGTHRPGTTIYCINCGKTSDVEPVDKSYTCPHCDSDDLEIIITESETFTIEPGGELGEISGAQDILEAVIYCRECDENLDQHYEYNYAKNIVERSDQDETL